MTRFGLGLDRGIVPVLLLAALLLLVPPAASAADDAADPSAAAPAPDSRISPGAAIPGEPIQVPLDGDEGSDRRAHPDRFALLDADHDGRISKSEASRDPRFLRAFADVDIDPADGEVSRAEFLRFETELHGQP